MGKVYDEQVNNKDVFVPPKPKEFDNAAFTAISLEAVKGMKASLKTGSGVLRLRVKGAIPWKKGKKNTSK